MHDTDIWGYAQDVGHQPGADLIGYKVEAVDGPVGKIDKHSEDVGSSYLVVDTGAWIFGKHVLLPAGTIRRIDTVEEKVHVDRTKDEIKNAPEYDDARHAGEPTYLEQFARYYGMPHI
ncbi:PRC-barrel domain-containing protein [Streptomyces sp. NPDC057540]|uniref:PRC-barrel domain-containing protein n=1 Tax=Streptomyces sp. NPDC057540 TaxID=3346160 RepID=UPI0036A9C89B